jgi:hypothetical protein
MRKLTVLCVLSAVVVMVMATGTASAFEGGGKMPSEAPLISPGVHYTASLSNRKEEANYAGSDQVAIWQLGPVSTHDKLVVNWHALPFAHSSSFPVDLAFVENVDDYSWGTAFGNALRAYEDDEASGIYGLSGSGTARTEITVQNSSSTDYLEFFSGSSKTETKDFETFLYDFSVEPPRHFLALTLTPVTQLPTNGVIEGAVVDALGLPAPDGLVFGLTATWGKGGVANYTASTVGGHLTFALALPESAVGQRATIAVGRGADAGFQAAAARTAANIKPALVPPPPPPSACETVSAELLPLERHLHRLRSHAKRARGRAVRKLRHRAHAVGQDVGKLKHRKRAVC